MNIDWTEELVKFILDRQFQSVSKTIIEVQDTFGIVLTEKTLNRKYARILQGSGGKKKKKVRIHYRSFRARGIQYWYTVSKLGKIYVGALHTEPHVIESAPTQVDLKIAMRAAKLSYIKDMDKLVDPEIAYRIRDQWEKTNVVPAKLSKDYNLSMEIIHGIIRGDIHPTPNSPGGITNKARGILLEIFEEEPAKSILEWTKDPRCRTTWRTIYKRWENGIRGSALLKESISRESKYYYIYGEYKTISEWIDDPRCEVSWQCLRKRIRAGHQLTSDILKKRAQ